MENNYKNLLNMKNIALLSLLFVTPIFVYLLYFANKNFIVDKMDYKIGSTGFELKKNVDPQLKNDNQKVSSEDDNEYYKGQSVEFYEIVDYSKKDSESSNDPFYTGIKISNIDLPNPRFVKWNNYLIGMNIEKYMQKTEYKNSPGARYDISANFRNVIVYNIDTGETYDIPLADPEWGQDLWYATSQLVGDSYFFGVGGPYGASLQYKLDLPPKRNLTIKKLDKPVGDKIEKIGNIYLSSSCYEGCAYSLLDINTLTTKELKRLDESKYPEYGEEKKEKFVGIDSNGRMILLDESREYIVASPLKDESLTLKIKKISELPEKMLSYLMIDGIDKILMIGESKAYILNLETQKIVEIINEGKIKKDIELKTNFSDAFTLTKTHVCFVDTEKANYAFDMINEVYQDNPPSECKNLLYDKTSEEIFQDLKLPEYFKLVKNRNIYQTAK